MSAYITGDTHGGFQRFGMKYFPEQKKMNREDTVIIAGDFGGLWGGTPAEEYCHAERAAGKVVAWRQDP